MTPKEREHDRQSKYRAILEAAVDTFNEHGFHNASLDEVAARLGITKPTIYHHVGNKEKILLDCFEAGVSELRKSIEEVRDRGGDGLSKLQAFARVYALNATTPFGKLVNRTNESALSKEGAAAFRKLRAEIDRNMRELIQQGIDDGTIAPGDVRLMAFALAGSLSWVARWYDPKGKLSPNDAADGIIQVIVNGLRNHHPVSESGPTALDGLTPTSTQ